MITNELKPVHLVMVTAVNNNKYYDMTPKGDHIEIRYGRIDATCTVCKKPIREWNSIYNSKIRKGYVDKSDLITEIVEKADKPGDFDYIPINDKVIADIVDRLQDYAKKVISANYKLNSKQVTKRMLDEAQFIINGLLNRRTVSDFNNQLLKLFATIPRRMGNVSDYLAGAPNDFLVIINKEQSLLDTLRGQVVTVDVRENETADVSEATEYKNNITILEAFGIKIEPTTKSDVAKIKKELGEEVDRYINSWKVVNIDQDKKYKSYCKATGVKKKDTKLLWHGTRNENVWNILKTGLVLRPTNVVISGKMFGYGIYFAPRARKSIGYTSTSGSYWANGDAPSGFMILHECAYGTPYDVYCHESRYTNFDHTSLQKEKEGTNCLHAHAGEMLRNDEIIFYQENQMTAKYLVEIR